MIAPPPHLSVFKVGMQCENPLHKNRTCGRASHSHSNVRVPACADPTENLLVRMGSHLDNWIRGDGADTIGCKDVLGLCGQ